MIAIARATLARAFRAPGTWLLVAAWAALALIVAATARASQTSAGASRVLVDIVGALVVPFSTYALAGAILGPRALALSAAEVAAFGAPPAQVAATSIAVLAALSALISSALAAVVAALAHGVSDPPLLRDVVTSAYVAALGSIAYAAWFALGSTLGRAGGGRAALLALDWAIGVGSGSLSLFAPRAHLRNLFGGAAPIQLPERSSAAILAAMTFVAAAWAIRRAERRL